MTVTGFPAAADIVLSTLLATETLSSWKVDGNENQTVVVLRFTKGQPFAMDNAQARFRLKPPAQVRRDRKRAQVHRECINGRSTYLSSVPRELPEVNNPSDCTDTTVKDICTPARGELPPVTSDPPPSGRCQIGDKSRSTVPAHRDDHCNTEGQPSQTSADASFVQDIQSMFSEVNRKLEQATAVAKSCVGGSASGRKAEIREDTDVGLPTTSDPPEDRRAPPGRTVQVQPPHEAQANSDHRSGNHGDRPSSTRPQRKRTARKT